MALQCKQFEFTANITTGVQTIVSSLPFTPIGYIITSAQTTGTDSFSGHAGFQFGFSDGTTSACVTVAMEDNAATSDTGTSYSGDVIRTILSSAPDLTTDSIAQHSQFGSDFIEINWTDAPGGAVRFMGIAIGGSGIQVEAKAFTTGTTATGNTDYTTLSFQPDCGIFLCPSSTSAAPNQAAHASTMIGAAISSTKRFLVGMDSEDARTTIDSWSYADNTKCLGGWVRDTGAMDFLADFVSWLSNGFRLNYTDAPTSASTIFYGFFIKGGLFDIGTLAKRTTTGTSQVTTATGSSSALQGVMLFSNCQQNSTSIRTHSRMSVGIASSTTDEGGVWCGDQDNAGTSIATRYFDTANIFIMATENDTITSSVIEGQAGVTVLGVDTFTINYTTATAVAADIFWLAMGGVTQQNFNGNITETSITVNQTLDRILGATRPISETSITINQTLSRILGALRPISETAITVDQTIARTRNVPRTISETAISSNETLTRLLASIRSPTENVTIDQTLARILGAIRTINQTVTVSETLDGTLTFLRPISESAISVNQTLTGIFGALRPISESAISVNQTIATLLATIRSIPQTVSVSENLAKVYSTVRSITEGAISINDSLVRILGALRTINQTVTTDDTVTGTESALAEINETAVNVNQSLVRILGAIRSPTEDAITVNQSVTATLIYLRTINESAITISDTLTTLLGAVRTLTQSYEISEAITRITQIFKSITEPSITEDDSVIATIGFLRSISEDPINEDDVVIRLLGAIRSSSETAITVNEALSRLQTLTINISEGSVNINQTIQALRASFANITEARIKWYYSLLVYKTEGA